MTGYGYEANKIITAAAGDRKNWSSHDEALLHLCVGADDEIKHLKDENRKLRAEAETGKKIDNDFYDEYADEDSYGLS